MKKFILIGLIGLTLISCNKSNKWEYKKVTVKGLESQTSPSFFRRQIDLEEEELNKLGKEGWELVGTYETLETTHPNYGDDKYVTGLQPNTRTYSVTLIFKR